MEAVFQRLLSSIQLVEEIVALEEEVEVEAQQQVEVGVERNSLVDKISRYLVLYKRQGLHQLALTITITSTRTTKKGEVVCGLVIHNSL